MGDIVTTRKPQTLMILLVVTKEARGSSGWQPMLVPSDNESQFFQVLEAVSIRKMVLPGMAIPMLKIRLTAVLSLTWKLPYIDKTVFILRRGPGSLP